MSNCTGLAMAVTLLLATATSGNARAQISLDINNAPAESTDRAVLRVTEPTGDSNGGHGGHGADMPAQDTGVAALADLTITQVFSRATVARSGAAYLVVTNDGGEPDRLIAADAPVAAKVELHNMTVVDDVMQMAEVEGGIEIPAQGAVTLAPGGLHVMMMGLNGALASGSSFPLTLTFEHAGQITIEVPILDATADGAHSHDMR